MELLIYVPKITNRIYYIFELLFKNELGIDFKFTTDKVQFSLYEGNKFQYAEYPIVDNALFQKSVDLLFKRDISNQEIKICNHLDSKAIFPIFNEKSIFSFDIFAASFYIIRSKKRGQKCIGCPYAKTCKSKNCCSKNNSNSFECHKK